MFSLYKKELQSYFLSPAAYAVLAFFTLTFSLTMIMDISTATQLYEFSFTSLFMLTCFYLAILFPVLTMRALQRNGKTGQKFSAIQPYQRHQNRDRKVFGNRYCLFDYAGDIIILPNYHRFKRTCHSC